MAWELNLDPKLHKSKSKINQNVYPRIIEWNMSIIIREGEVVKKTVIDSERLEICAVVTIFRVKVSCISSAYGIKQSLNEF